PRRLTASPAESEQLERKSSTTRYFHKYQFTHKQSNDESERFRIVRIFFNQALLFQPQLFFPRYNRTFCDGK
ncbi:hypothetical protein, partial [Rossellomorea vietnamensis]|uniref:hypothetical protein n=1 Tax=Rossellomorea vietnamensis TaxID=218284 RepID=UPI001C3F2DFA